MWDLKVSWFRYPSKKKKDQFTGIDQGMAWINTSSDNSNTRAGKVRRTPSKNLIVMADDNLTKLIKPVYIRVRDPHNSRDGWLRRTDSSAYEIPIQEFKSTLISLSIQ